MECKLKVVFYGLSSEGVRLAEKFAEKHDTVFIDEDLKLALPFRGKSLIPHRLMERELLPLSSYTESLSSADVIFFSPKMKKIGGEGRADLLLRLKDLSRYMPEGSTIIYLLPMAIRKTQEILAIIEDQSGLREGKDFNFIYSPLSPEGRLQGFVGSSQGTIPKEVSKLLGRVQVLPYYLAELRHYRRVFSSIIKQAMKLIFQEPNGELYISEAVKGLLDAHVLASSVSTSNPSFHIASSLIKGVDFYLKTLENFLRQVAKRMGLKAIRTHVLLLWDNDPYELRGDAYRTKQALQARLREAFGSVEAPAILTSTIPMFPMVERSNLIVVCTKRDEEEIRRLKKTKGVVRATAPPTFLNP